MCRFFHGLWRVNVSVSSHASEANALQNSQFLCFGFFLDVMASDSYVADPGLELSIFLYQCSLYLLLSQFPHLSSCCSPSSSSGLFSSLKSSLGWRLNAVPIPACVALSISQGTTWKCDSWGPLQSLSVTLSVEFRGPLAHEGTSSTLRIIILAYASGSDSFTIHSCVHSLR